MNPLLLAVIIACAALPARAIPVSLSVVGPDDKPLADAVIELRQGDGYGLPGYAKLQPLAPPVANGERWSFEWDGQFAADDDAPNAERLEAKRVLWARVSAPGMASQTRLLSAPATTVRLMPGRVWSGVVRDQNEKPIAGVRVQLKSWSLGAGASKSTPTTDAPQDNLQDSFVAADESWVVETATDAQGRWQLDDLPAGGTANIALRKAPYARAAFDLNLKDETAPPLFLKPGAAIAGQIVAPDGQPITGQLVVASWSGDRDAQTRTDAQGCFEIDGLAAGQTHLSPRDYTSGQREPAPQFLLPQQDMIKLSAGETTDIGQWQAQLGTTIKMRVVDAATGQPVEGAQFNSFRGGDLAKSDVKGELQARVMRNDSIAPSFGSVWAEGYKSASVAQPVDLPEGGAVDAGVIKLERGSVVRGTVRAQSEDAPADWPTLSFQMGDANNSQYFNLDEKKSFVTGAMKPGIYSVYAYKSWGSEPSKDWEVVSPKTITVPAPDVEFKPIEIVFKRLKPAPNLIESARGRLLDENGDGVAGAIVTGQFTRGYNSSSAQTITDANGNWSNRSGISATEFKIASIERPGYNQAGDAQIRIADGVATVSGLSLKRRGATFAARVIAADGTPAGGAWIAVVEARYYAPVRAGENGQFALPNLPLEKFTLIAAQGADWARVETEASARNSEIKLKNSAPFERAAAVEEALRGPSEWYSSEAYWDELGWERMEQLSESKGEGNDWDRAQFALQLARREPAIFLERAPALLPKIGESYRSEVELQWRLAQASSADAHARTEASSWVDAGKTAKKAIDAASVTQLLQLAAVAGQLGRADAADLRDYAAAIAAQLSAGAGDAAEDWGAVLGQSGYPVTREFAEGLKPVAEFNLWTRAIGAIAQSGDVAGTKAAIARMETLAATPQWVALAAQQFWNNPVEKIGWARAESARSLADTDLPAALALIENSQDSDYAKSRAARTLADRSMRAGDLATAEKLLRGTMKSRISNAEGFALSASLAQSVSPQLANELWADAFRRAVPSQPDTNSSFETSVAMWAFYHARLDAAQSRVLIEREWNWQMAAFAKIADDDKLRDKAIELRWLEMAMGAVDPARALQMRAQADKLDKAPSANVGLAVALLSSDAQRARLGVDGRF